MAFPGEPGSGISRSVFIKRQPYGVDVTETIDEKSGAVSLTWNEIEQALLMRAGRIQSFSGIAAGDPLIDGPIVRSVRSQKG